MIVRYDIHCMNLLEVHLQKARKNMREINIGTKRFTNVVSLDEKGQGGARHAYEVKSVQGKRVFAKVNFQNGPVKEHGINGCHQEDLLAIVIDRLQCFQNGDFKCRENAIAITKLEEAMLWLNKRTNDRIARGVEGTNIK